MKKNNRVLLNLVLAFFLFSTTNIFSQTIFIKVKKGNISKNNVKLSDTTSIFKLESKDLLIIPDKAFVIAQRDNTYVEIPKRDKPYTFKEIASIKTSSKPYKKTPPGVFESVLKNSMQHTSKNIGAVSRGFDREADFFAPEDSLTFLSDTIELEFGNEITKVESNFIVKNESENKVYYDEKPLKNKIILSNLPMGVYSWKGTIKSSTEKITYNNIFIIKAAIFKKDFSKKINDFKKYLDEETDYSNEMKQILIKEFYASEKVYFKE
jgi:hypothetical protein